MEENFTTIDSKKNFELSEDAQGFLKETAKWGYFLSILGFISLGLMVLLAVFIGTIFSALSSFSSGMNPMMGIGSGFFSAIYLFMAALYFFPIYYLFQFSSNTKKAFKNNDNDLLTASFGYLKSHYKFIGITAIVFISFYVLIFIASLIFGMRSAM